MAEFFFDYGLFALKALTIVVAILVVVMMSVAAGMRTKKATEGHIEVTKINDEIDNSRETLASIVVDAETFKAQAKQKKKTEKAERKAKKKALKKESGAEKEN
ncbi:MAG: protease SohB, partial [Pseudomonadota bacterium]